MIKFLKASVLVTVLATGVVSPVSAQVKRQEYVIVFYDNENHDNIVGQRVVFCDGTSTRIGMASIYDEEIYYGCA